ncbi:MAG TPA: ABC transporter ATP-binding protein, partial [Pirellula sp.]|nr:ABC transporter ATP-binding protein [Pirellula sp.]
LNFGAFVRKHYHQYMMQLRDEQNELSKFRRNSNLLMLIPGQVIGAVMLVILIQQVFAGSLSLTAMFVVAGSLERFPNALFGILNTGVELRSNALKYEYLQKLLATKPVIDESNAEDTHFDHCPDLKVKIVSFQYPSQKGFALRECSVDIPSGQKIALVGMNGSGKTTLARLLGKVFLPTSGTIYVDNQSIEGITQRSWINHALYLGQRFRPLELTVDYAITGSPLEEADSKRFSLATSIAGTDEFISPLSGGYKSQIGEQWPDGVGFSGGQIQRLALASALYRFLDPEVWIGIFDEPMSDCDIQTRERFYRSITSRTNGKTIIVIAHDPMYLHFFERVIVMDHGKVIKDLTGEDIKSYQAESLIVEV